jgi:hypothetical protein
VQRAAGELNVQLLSGHRDSEWYGRSNDNTDNRHRSENLVVTTSRIVGACFAGDRLECGTVRTWRATERSQEMAALHAKSADSLRHGDAFSSARLRWFQLWE